MDYQLSELQFLLAQGAEDVPKERPEPQLRLTTTVPEHTFEISLFPEDLALIA